MPSANDQLTRVFAASEIIELGHDLFVGSPRVKAHAPFMYVMTEQHRTNSPLPGQPPEVTGASDMFSMGCHCGTHIDSLAHIACNACLADGTIVLDPGVEDLTRGITMAHRRSLTPIVAPGVLLDFAAYFGVDILDDDVAITPEDFEGCAERQGVSISPGDVVLVRTGRDLTFEDTQTFERFPMPGPNLASAKLLVSRGIVATGSDTLAYEHMPGEHPLEAHAELISKAGIHILEALNLATLAARKLYRFGFVVLPLRIKGATGSPVNPVALVSAG